MLEWPIRPCAHDVTGSTNITKLLRSAKGTLVACPPDCAVDVPVQWWISNGSLHGARMNYDYCKRGYLLPEGCKDLIDVLNLTDKGFSRKAEQPVLRRVDHQE